MGVFELSGKISQMSHYCRQLNIINFDEELQNLSNKAVTQMIGDRTIHTYILKIVIVV